MYLQAFHQITDGLINIAPEQASRFAKGVAGDFNPLHDPDAKRFCVPGDLLFSLVLARYGLSQQMYFNYTGMVGNGVSLVFPQVPGEEFRITDNNDKSYLEVMREGENTLDQPLIEAFTRAYVAFSGHNFPHILIPLMQQQQVMINPERPLVIYESMSFRLDRLDCRAPAMELADCTLEVKGKRGEAKLLFHVCENGETIGKGCKSLVLSGLRPYEQDKIQELIDRYEEIRDNYTSL